MTEFTTRTTIAIAADAITAAHDFLLTLEQPQGTRFFGTEPTDGDYLIVSTVLRPSTAEAYRQCAEEIEGVSIVPSVSPWASTDFPPLPAEGEPVEMGTIYADGDDLWMARQSHPRTHHDPADVLALFARYCTADQRDEWISAEKVEVGDVRRYDGQLYWCKQGHTTEFEPPIVPALWRLIEPEEPEELEEPIEPDEPTEPDPDFPQWEPGISVEVGEVYEYEGDLYRVRQTHGTEIGWEPPVVPALWWSLVNINTSSATDLATLPGIGPSTAQAIIDDRPYDEVDDLTRVSGIGQATADGLRDQVIV